MVSVWPALLGYSLGSFQVVAIDWFRQRASHRRQLRMLRAELRRLSEFSMPFNWGVDGPADDFVPNPPTITTGYTRLLQEIDFWLTDEHKDDNTQQALINVADGTAVIAGHAEAVHDLAVRIEGADGQAAREKLRERALGNAEAYDVQPKRWVLMVTVHSKTLGGDSAPPELGLSSGESSVQCPRTRTRNRFLPYVDCGRITSGRFDRG